MIEARRETGEGEDEEVSAATPPPVAARVLDRLGPRSIVLIGMMGAGKTSVGRRLAARLGLDFVDADQAIEEAANQTVPEIFAQHGEAYFREGERRVIARLLRDGRRVIATGGGAFMNAETRAAIRAAGVSVWLKADAAVLFERVKRRPTRPLLQTADPLGTLKRLVEERYPVYADSDITILSRDVPHEAVVDDVVAALLPWLDAEAAGADRTSGIPES
ncbi:shikimate kinase [Methylobrevis albus]|uniref:Shikimate kinase n=1 Tax=Methylobrevis albus TaxID=2793297 RepID=A0A931I1K0_9HYPH|nr:shikimate kinase [Methylobrevis albus]MBH0237276.1 shikimate kinase [Methylobrevis albus]